MLQIKGQQQPAVLSLEVDNNFPTLFVEKNGKRVELLYITDDGAIALQTVDGRARQLLEGDISFDDDNQVLIV